MSKTDNTRPPKFGGRTAFYQAFFSDDGSYDESRETVKGHPRESFRVGKNHYHRRDRRLARQATSRGDSPSVQDHRHDVLWDRW